MRDQESTVAAVVGITIVIVALGVLAMQPYFEARAFNKFSKTKATYWDAVWTQLRVMPDGGKE